MKKLVKDNSNNIIDFFQFKKINTFKTRIENGRLINNNLNAKGFIFNDDDNEVLKHIKILDFDINFINGSLSVVVNEFELV